MGERWKRVGELFDAARAVPDGQREAWVRSRCDDARVAAEVLALLRAYEEEPGFLEQPVPADMADAALRMAAAPAPQRSIGAYRLVREIGRGGMGVVYEAEQTDAEFSRRVAIKFVPSGWNATSLVARFRYERRVLARLEHPGIARLLDARSTDEGTPYFVMEYVNGQPIDEWCRDRSLTVRQRIELVLQVLDAVVYAHRNLVVHRDLKAANILVTPDGQPKLLDFGIAKMFSEEAESIGDLTATGDAGFTPAYASPEQIRGETITTASDVYSLGVLLSLLMTGRLPYDVSGLSPFDAMRRVCEAEPALPSTVAPPAWTRTLRGDLDNIVMLALRKDPRERYRSVHAMADDLRAWCEGRAVSASPPTLWYRTRKFVVRRKVQALAAAAVVVALIAGGVATERQARVARLERDKAENRFREVRQFSRAVLFDLHDAIRGLPGSTPARELLISRAVRFLDGLARDAGNDDALKLELAEGYRKLGHVRGSGFSENLGDTGSAIESFQKAVRLGEDVLARQPRSVQAAILLAGAYDDLTTVASGQGDGSTAEAAYRRHRRLVEKLERDHPDDASVRIALASSCSNLAYYRGTRADWPEAKALYVKAIALYEALPRPESVQVRAERLRSHAFALKRLGAIQIKEGNLDEAERRYSAALALDEEVVAAHTDNVSFRYDLTFSLSDLGLIAKRRNDFGRAESFWMRALAIRKAALAADPKNARAWSGVANVHGYLGGLYQLQKHVDEEILHRREELRFRDRLVAVKSPSPTDVAFRAEAQIHLARALLDRAATERGARRTSSMSEAAQLLRLAERVARSSVDKQLPDAAYIVKTFEEQSRRLVPRSSPRRNQP